MRDCRIGHTVGSKIQKGIQDIYLYSKMESVKYNILVPSFLLNNDVFFFFIRPSLININ